MTHAAARDHEQFTILTVCTGNICRSPLAALHLRRGLAGVPGVTVVSAGTRARQDDVMPDDALALAGHYGLDGRQHRARYLTERDVAGAQLVLGMSKEHRSAVVSLYPRAVKTTFSLREFARLAQEVNVEDLRVLQGLDHDDVRGRLQTMVALVAARRGQAAQPVDPEADNIVDPYRRSEEVYRESGDQLVPASEVTVRTLLSALARPGTADVQEAHR